MKKFIIGMLPLVSLSVFAVSSVEKTPYAGEMFSGIEDAYGADIPNSLCTLTINSDKRILEGANNEYNHSGELFQKGNRKANVSLTYKYETFWGTERTKTIENISISSRLFPLGATGDNYLFTLGAYGRRGLTTVAVYYDKGDLFLPTTFIVEVDGEKVTHCSL
jgi:hypothetical protein